MDASFVAHRSSDGQRLHAILSLSVLRSLDHRKIGALNELGIRTLSDLLHYLPVHRARLLRAIASGLVAHDQDLAPLLRDSFTTTDVRTLVDATVGVVDGIGDAAASTFRSEFGIETIGQLADFPPFVEAEALIRATNDAFIEPASAPDDLIPTLAGATSSTIRFSSFVKERDLELNGFEFEPLVAPKEAVEQKLVAAVRTGAGARVAVGYMARHLQTWTATGVALGELIHSLGLAPAESRNIVIVDWRRSLRATRAEETSVTEQLQNLLVHARSLDEIARAVAEEHQSGRTSTASATGVTAGGAVAAGALIGAIGGAVVGGTTGLAVDIAVGGTDLGAGTITGTILGSIAGSAWVRVPGAQRRV